MILVHPRIEEQIEFKENVINVLCIENKALFNEIVSDFLVQINGEDGDFILSEKGKELPIKKSVELVLSPFIMDFNSKKILSSIYGDLKENAYQQDYYANTVKLLSEISGYISNVVDEYKYPLEISEEINIEDVFKLASLKVDNSNSTLVDKIVDYVELVTTVLNVKLVVFVNLKSYIEEEQLGELYKTIINKKINVLLIENMMISSKIEGEKGIIIDKDLCEISY